MCVCIYLQFLLKILMDKNELYIQKHQLLFNLS